MMLRRLRAYVRKVFHLDTLAAAQLHDRREKPRLGLVTIWMTALLMYVANYGSLHALDEDLKRRHGSGTGKRPCGAPSERTIRRIFSWLNLDELRAMVTAMVRLLERNKVPLTLARSHGLVAAAFDGKEIFAGPVRGCADCLERTVHVKDRRTGQKREQKEYYHRVAVCFLVDGLIPILLDVELLQAGEGELSAARRLLKRVLKNHARLFDVATGDALYADKEFLQMILHAHKHFVVVLKDDRREVYDEADRLRRGLEPSTWSDYDRRCTVWDIEHLPSWWRGPKVELRVIWSEEKSLRPIPGRRRRGEAQWIPSTWVWLTDLPARLCSAKDVWRFGHCRWHIENRCFHEGVMEWGFDHCFHHTPNAIVAFLLTMGIAMMLVHTFLKRNVKETLRRLFTVLSLRSQFLRELGAALSWSGWARGNLLNTS
jgi:Transposase DDE domain